jgi:uncharacterized membrane protein YidH (DUF202 family)
VTPTPDQERLDVDVRFLLANERTLLAWLRTALTMQAGGVALIQLAGHSRVLAAVSLGLLALGSAAAVVGFLRYRAMTFPRAGWSRARRGDATARSVPVEITHGSAPA